MQRAPVDQWWCITVELSNHRHSASSAKGKAAFEQKYCNSLVATEWVTEVATARGSTTKETTGTVQGQQHSIEENYALAKVTWRDKQMRCEQTQGVGPRNVIPIPAKCCKVQQELVGRLCLQKLMTYRKLNGKSSPLPKVAERRIWKIIKLPG